MLRFKIFKRDNIWVVREVTPMGFVVHTAWCATFDDAVKSIRTLLKYA